jgi:hypothetical protein
MQRRACAVWNAAMMKSIVVLAVIMTPFAGFSAAAQAPQCGAKVIKATGGPGILENMAKSKARSAWMQRVRASKKYGPGYAAWLRAKDPTYACRKLNRRVVCEASAIPCKV